MNMVGMQYLNIATADMQGEILTLEYSTSNTYDPWMKTGSLVVKAPYQIT